MRTKRRKDPEHTEKKIEKSWGNPQSSKSSEPYFTEFRIWF
jgi:hypothetical protein